MTLMAVAVSIFPSRAIAFLYVSVGMVFATKRPVMGLVGWIIGYPFLTVFSNNIGLPGYLVLAPLIIGAFLSLCMRRERIRLPIGILVFSLVFITNAGVSLLLARDPIESLVSFGC